jgi:hypothetical protein
MDLTLDRRKWQAVAGTVTNIRTLCWAENILAFKTTVSLSRSTLLKVLLFVASDEDSKPRR